jgi:hypothetical protein
MTNMTEQQLAALIANVVGQVLAGQTAAPKASPSKFLPKGSHAAPSDLASRDQQILNAFHRKGFKDVQLLDRTDPTKPFNVKPFKAWLDAGRVVRRGQKSVKGLFHVSQTDPLPGKAAAKPAISAETKTLLETAKKALKAKKAQSTLPLA